MARVVTIPIGPIFTSGPCRGIIHVIEKGDTLYKLGQRYHVSVSRIMYANPYVNIYNLQIGDELCIPVGQEPRAGESMGQTEFDNLPGRQNMTQRMPVEQEMAMDWNRAGEMADDGSMAEEMRQPGSRMPVEAETVLNRDMSEELMDGQNMPGNERQPEEIEQPGSRVMSDPWSRPKDTRLPGEGSADNRNMSDFMTHPPMEGMFEEGYMTENRARSKEQCKSHYPIS